LRGLFDFLAPQQRLLQQQREISRLAKEVAQLRAQNASMRQGMRRCVTCEYRIDFKQRQGAADIESD
jgi:cell division protein FtsB